jgi:hypothetical protein
MKNPRLHVAADPKAFPNYAVSKGEVYPNLTQVSKKDYEDFRNLVALEHAYYINNL